MLAALPLHDDGRLQLQWRQITIIRVNKAGAKRNHVLRLPPFKISLIHGHEYPGPFIVELRQLASRFKDGFMADLDQFRRSLVAVVEGPEGGLRTFVAGQHGNEEKENSFTDIADYCDCKTSNVGYNAFYSSQNFRIEGTLCLLPDP